jgi:hypothetical protein
MSSQESPLDVVHPIYGPGRILAEISLSRVDVLWSGMVMARRESVADLARWRTEVEQALTPDERKRALARKIAATKRAARRAASA